MASIPLLCNVCPKEPEFSDISHLLTHVASKGHLSQYHKAQIRGRQDATIRGKLAIYDRWYERYQIEKLLSERMIAKESRDTSSRKPSSNVKSIPAASVKVAKPRKRRATTTAKQRVGPPLRTLSFIADKNLQNEFSSPVKAEGNIDPQLSQALRATPFNRDASPFSPLGRVTSRSAELPRRNPIARQRAHIPRMDGWQNPTTPPHASPGPASTKAAVASHPASDHRQETDSGSDYFRTFIRSPTRAAYPDPSELVTFPPALSPILRSSRLGGTDQLSDADKSSMVQSPMLKGIKWPGMSLFDSASVEAQRRRNQKKDVSILEQMEQNSVSVEQIERIYWPDGGLKQQRLITGNVESSPARDSTPMSPPQKRQRTKASKAVLKDLDKNVLKRPRKPRATKANAAIRVEANSQERSDEMLVTPSPTRFVYPRTAHMGYDPPNDDQDEEQRNRGRATKGRRRAFDVYHDHDNDDDEKGDEGTVEFLGKDHHSFARRGHGHNGLRHQSAANFTLFRKTSDRLPWDAQLRAFAGKSHRFTAEEDGENIEPMLDTAGRVDDDVGMMNQERVTQRYFSVATNQSPQFYNSMPPQMEFGGSFGPKYHGSILNPLNTSFRHQHSPFYRPQPIPRFAPPDATGNRTCLEKHAHSGSSTLARSRD